MLIHTDPFELFQRFFRDSGLPRPVAPVDAYVQGDEFVVAIDLPGVRQDSIELTVTQNVVTVEAERAASAPEGVQFVVAERATGTVRRQLFLGENLDIDKIQARYEAGVLTLHIPVAEQAKPHKIAVTTADRKEINA